MWDVYVAYLTMCLVYHTVNYSHILSLANVTIFLLLKPWLQEK